MVKRIRWYWALPAAVGSALIVAAVLLLITTTAGGTPTASAVDDVVTPYCDLQIVKEANESEVEAGGRITYTITVTNIANEIGEYQAEGCINPEVTDNLPSDLECVSVSVVENEDHLGFSQTAINESCEDDEVDVQFTGSLAEGDQVVIRLRVDTDEDLEGGERVSNTACVSAEALPAEPTGELIVDQAEPVTVGPFCDTERVRIEEEPTATPTNTPVPPTSTPVVIIVQPTATPKPLATLAPPRTGTGTDGGSSPWLPVGLGISGLALLAVAGGAMAKRRAH